MKIIIVLATLLPFVHASDDDHYPKGCHVRTPEMRMLRTCFSGAMASSEDRGRFLSTVDSNGNGANYCFNAFAMTSAANGPSIPLRVLKDNESDQLRDATYTIPAADLGSSHRTFRLEGLNARCFARQPEFDHCSDGFFGVGSTDRSFALEFSDTKAIKGPVLDDQAPAINATGNQDVAGAIAMAQALVREKLLKVAKTQSEAIHSGKSIPSEQVNRLASFQACHEAYSTYMRDRKLSSQLQPADEALIADYTRLASGTTAPASSGVSTKGAEGGAKH